MPSKMTDLELTKLCAEAMGFDFKVDDVLGIYMPRDKDWNDMIFASLIW